VYTTRRHTQKRVADRRCSTDTQEGRALRCTTPSPLNCSCVIFETRASNSAADMLSQTGRSRCMRSLRTHSSLLSWLLRERARELKMVSSSGTRIGVIENFILPHMAAERSPERRGKRDKRPLWLVALAKYAWQPSCKQQGCSQTVRRNCFCLFCSKVR
jgi:hypothetical protein